MGRPLQASPFLLLLCWLGASWSNRMSHAVTPSNVTIFSHVYTIRMPGDSAEQLEEGDSHSPQEALGPPGSSRGGGLYEHTLEGPDQEHVVFTHRINLPPQSCGCPPGTEDTRDLLRRLQALENEVRTLRDTCQASGGCCSAPANTQASTGQTDIRTLCSHHGSFDLSRCVCECEPGWSGPTCAESACPGGCGGPQRGHCVDGHCQCRPGYSGSHCEEPPSCPDDCNDQGRCVDGRCTCFPGFIGPSCADPACPNDCQGHGQCVSGRCVCHPGYSGPDCGVQACPSNCNRNGVCREGHCACDPGYSGRDCGTRTCPSNCNQHGECRDGHCVCNPGYSGPDCSTQDCPNNCNQHGKCRNGRCVCEPGYSGPDCGNRACPKNCNRRGVCRDGVCVCDPGYSGPDCGTRACPNNCNEHGECRNGRCVCNPGYSGPDCGNRACPKNCNRRGMCRDGQCVCEPGYSGPDCGTRACPNNCNEHGECRNGRCVCNPGYSGQDCGTQTCPSNCKQHGECRDGHCVCNPGYSGPDCGTRTCPSNCNQHGKCHDGHCVCESGYSGPDCGTRACPNNCNERGECRDGHCVCDAGYSGPDCGTQTCPNNCNQRGECRNGRCVCNPGYSGPDCGTRACPNNCNERGECHDGHCVCNPGYSGPDCGTRACPNNCNERGECHDGHCVCDPGYSGPDCGTLACPSNCNQHGECRDGHCVCDPGYSGPDCGTQTCPNNCNEHGECRDGQCVCDPGYSGPDCGTQDCPNNCNQHGECRDGRCVCNSGYSGPDCGTRACPSNCNRRGECRNGRCVCEPGFTGLACGTKSCPNDCNQRGRCLKGGVCSCLRGYTGPDCSELACPADCSGHGDCRKGVCQCHDGYSGEDCSLEIPSIDIRVTNRDERSFRLQWDRPETPVDGYEIQVFPTDGEADESTRLPGTETTFERTGLEPGEEYNVTIRAEKGQNYGPPVTQTVRTRVAPPQGLKPVDVTENTLTLKWEPPTVRPDNYILSYVPLAAGRPTQPPKRLELPAAPERVTLEDLESNTRYRIILITRRGGESSRPTSITATTIAPEPNPSTDLYMTLASSPSRDPGIVSSSGPETGKSGTKTRFGHAPSNSTPLPNHRFLDKMVHNISAKLSPFNGTLLERLESYIRATNFPLHGNRTIQGVAKAIYTYLIRWKPLVFQEMVYNRLVEETDGSPPKRDLEDRNAAFSEAYTPPEHAKPAVVATSHNGIEVSLDGVRGVSENVVIRYHIVGSDQGGELVVPGGTSTAVIPGLDPGTSYQVEIHGVVKGHSSKSYSFVTTTAPDAPTADKIQTIPGPSPTSEVPLGDLTVTDVSRDSLRVTWIAPPNSFQSFSLLYKDPNSNEPPGQVRVPGTERSVTVTGLTPNTEYDLELRGETDDGTNSSPIAAKTSTEPVVKKNKKKVPPTLGELSVSDVTDDSVRLSWSIPSGASFDSFVIQYKDAKGRPQMLPVVGDSREATIPGLAPSRRYKFNFYGISDHKRFGPIAADVTTAASPKEKKLREPALGDLSVSDTTSDSVRLSWKVPEGNFDSFLLRYQDSEGNDQDLPVEGGSREITVPNLTPSQRYIFNLYGISGSQHIGPVSADAVTGSTPRGIVTRPTLGGLSVSDIMRDSVRLSWTVPTGSFDSFLVQFKDAEGKPQVLPVDGDSREITVPNLVPSRRYKFNLYGMSGGKRSGPISVDATTDSIRDTLGELSVSDITSDSVRLSWTAPPGSFNSFLVRFKDAEGKPQALPVEGGSREVTVPNLAPSHRYKFNLYGVSDNKRSGPISADATTAAASSVEVTAQTVTVELSVEQFLVSDITSDSVRLSWIVPYGDFDSFLVRYTDADGTPQALPVEGGSRTLRVPNLKPSQRYQFDLYGVVDGKLLGPLSVNAVTALLPTTAPPQPSLGDLSISEVTSNSARLSWTVPAGTFDSFVIQYKDAEGKPQTLPIEGVSREVTISNLAPSRRYKFNLYGVSGPKRLGPVSTDTVTASPPHEPPSIPPSLGELSASDVTSNSVRLSWDVPTGTFDSFQIQYKDAEGKPQSLPVEGSSREITVPSLVPSRRYKFNLYGITKRKRLGPVSTDAVTGPESTESTESTVQVDLARPQLGELSASDVTSHSCLLSWTVPAGTFDSFQIRYRDAEGKPQALPVEGSAREVTLPNLAPSHKYKFNLYGVSGRERFGPISTEVTTPEVKDESESDEKQKEDDDNDGDGRKPSLGDLLVSETTPDSVHLTWSVPAGSFHSFLVQYNNEENKPQELPVDGGSREVTVSNLAPSHRYQFDLYGISDHERLGPVSADAATDPSEQTSEGERPTTTVAPQPNLGELSFSDVTSNSARLSWDVPTGTFDSFLVQYNDAKGNPQVLPVDQWTNSVKIYDLVPSQRYNFSLYGVSGNRRFGPASVSLVTEDEDTPEPEPTTDKTATVSVQPSLGDATISEVTPDSLLLSWSVQEGSFDSFIIQYEDATGKPQVLPVDGTMRSLHLYNLMPSQRYKFTIYGVSGYNRLGPISTEAVTAPDETESTVQPSLGDLSVSQVTSNSVSLSWIVPTGTFDSFVIQYKDAEGKTQVLPLDGRSRKVTIPNLAPSRRYKFNLYGISGHKRLGPVSTDAVTGSAQPNLGELSAQNITPDTLLLSWTVEAENFDSFIIQYRDADGKPHALPVDGSLRSLRLHDLTPDHKYRFNLYGVVGRQRFGPVSTEAVTARAVSDPTTSPQPILGDLSASDATATSVRLSWNVPAGNFDSFIVQYRDANGKPQALPVGGSLRDVIISNLVPSRKYKFNLFGISGQKRIGPISTEAVTARTREPDRKPKLGDLSISEVTKSSVRLSWTVPSGKFDSFLIQYKDDQGNPQTLTADADSRTVVVSDLIPSQRYKFNLYGISGNKQIGPISTDAVTAFPEAISETDKLLDHLLVSEVTPTTLQLTWEVPKGEFDSFLVQYKDSLLGTGRGAPKAKEVKVPGDQRSTLLKGLSPNTEYSLTVYGIKDGLKLANVNTAGKTSGLELDSPRDLRFSDIRETSVVAHWMAPSSRIDHYKVSFQPSEGGEPRSITVDGSKLQTPIKGLTPGTSYEVSVMSLRGLEESEPLVGYVTTVPDGPSDLRAIDVTDSAAVLTWQPAVAEMNSYIVTYGPAGGPRVSESVPGNRAQLQVSGLHLDTEYRASVYGEKDGNRTTPVSATFTTGADGPRDLRAREISPRSARLTWSPPRAPADGYLLSYETPNGQTKEIPLDASVTSYGLQNLIPSSRYQVQVQALRRGIPTAPTSTSFTTGQLKFPFPRDCSEEIQNGPGPSREATIYLGGNPDRPLHVYCDMETDGGGWVVPNAAFGTGSEKKGGRKDWRLVSTAGRIFSVLRTRNKLGSSAIEQVFQRRMNGKTDFFRDWQDYATGFGNRSEEFWLGNDALHQLSTLGEYKLRIDLRAKNESVYATYESFRVDSPADYYRLHLGSYSGTAGDAFGYHSGSVFSTRDRDPNRLITPCAVSYRGAWWYHNCHYTNLNGVYGSNKDHQGITWFYWKGFEFSIPFTEMKLRPRSFQPSQVA